MSLIPSAARVFRESVGPATVLVEFSASAEPASLTPNNRLKRLSKDFNVEIIRRNKAAEDDATPAAFVPTRGLFEVQSRDERRAIDVASEIAASFGEEVATVLPVPFAIPAIAPEPEQPGVERAYSPDFRGLQNYRGPAPDGLGFSEVAHLPGADGAGVTVIDLEGGWLLGHEALRQVRFNLWTGTASKVSGWLEHGTAVSSMMLAPAAGSGIAGLVPGARGALASIFSGTPVRQTISQQIDACRALLGPGDVLLVEVQRPGPATDFEDDNNQRGYLPTSFWPDVRESIRASIAAGITVVEVAGNGGVNLAGPGLQGAFDQKGSTLTSLGAGDSGGIMVGAGHPPLGTQAARERLAFSNFGERLDCQAWGDSVVSAGYGDLWGTIGGNTSYTRHFMGTSSAGPLVAAAAIAIQGRHRRKFGKHIPPLSLRQILASFGTPQAAENTGRIGPQPDLADIFARLDLW